MHQLTYISTARAGLIDGDVDRILLSSRRNNHRDRISGLLVYDGVRFLQALEGEKDLVEAAFLRIKADPRHRAAVMLSLRETSVREFGTWDMACERVAIGKGGASVAETVDDLVAKLPDPNTKALFSSFARLDRSRAA